MTVEDRENLAEQIYGMLFRDDGKRMENYYLSCLDIADLISRRERTAVEGFAERVKMQYFNTTDTPEDSPATLSKQEIDTYWRDRYEEARKHHVEFLEEVVRGLIPKH